MFVIGTAGHVDHGKSTLIKTLTGMDPDRLKEEKDRQMTIDLGFAWLKLSSGDEIGIVDVPGHRDFIDNMLAGAGGIDAVLFIIAADEGIMPQSREHLAILDLLKIPRGLIVLTKIDLVKEDEWLDLVKSEIREFTIGSFLQDAPIIEVSSITGSGIELLRDSINILIKQCEPKKNLDQPRLPIDRVFTLKGFGTIVTGTLQDGKFSVGQQVEILPSKLQSRIRGIQNHKRKVSETGPGSRTAINLIGLDVSEIKRGDVVVMPDTFSPTQRIDVQISLLNDTQKGLSHNEYVKFYSGTSQTLARVRIIGKKVVSPGEKGWMQLELSHPLILKKGDAFILRRPSPPQTLGGGEILDDQPKGRIKRFSEKSLTHFNLMETGSEQEIILHVLQTNDPLSIQTLSEISGIATEKIITQISEIQNEKIKLLQSKTSTISSRTIITTKQKWEEISNSILCLIKEYHSQFPLRQGIVKEELCRSIGLSPKVFSFCINYLSDNNFLKENKNILFLPTHRPQFSAEDQRIISKILSRFEKSPYSPPSLSDLINEFGKEIIQAILNDGMLIQTSDDIVFRKRDFEFMIDGLEKYINKEGSIALNQFRDLFSTSRKYALSFLEYLDKKEITVRSGDKRILRLAETIDKD